MKNKVIALLDTSTLTLPKEKWKDIPAFEGLYQLSNYGRVRSLSRWVYSDNRPDSYRPGRIIKLHFNRGAENPKGINIQMKLHSDGIRHTLTVARYVYHLFVSPFDLSDHRFIVRRKDGDIMNCYYRNLELASISQVAVDDIQSGKRKNVFVLQSKPVSQYTLEGKFVKQYRTVREAGQATGVSPQYINDAARTKGRTTANAYWRYGTPRTRIQIVKFKQRLTHTQTIRRKRVQQLSLKGKPIRIYESVSAAAKATHQASCSNISYACQGKYKSSKGFIWRYVE